MPIKGISITKRVVFRDSTQEFSNVYFYRTLISSTQAEAAARIDELAALEKTWHGSHVTFVRGRFWTAGGTPAANEMIDQHNLSGTGAVTPVSGLDRERAHLFMWPAGLDSRGKPVFLRKWYHIGATINGATLSAAIQEDTTGFTQTQRDAMAANINAVKVIGSGAYALCAESGRDPTGNAQAHKYLEHHQLGDQWRAQ